MANFWYFISQKPEVFFWSFNVNLFVSSWTLNWSNLVFFGIPVWPPMTSKKPHVKLPFTFLAKICQSVYMGFSYAELLLITSQPEVTESWFWYQLVLLLKGFKITQFGLSVSFRLPANALWNFVYFGDRFVIAIRSLFIRQKFKYS